MGTRGAWLACALGALLLGGCGSDGDSGDDSGDEAPGDASTEVRPGDAGDALGGAPPADDDAPADGAVSGRVIEAVAGTPLAGVEIELLRFDDGRAVGAATSGADGGFSFDGLVRRDAYRLALSLDGYLDETVRNVRLPREGALALEPVRLVSDDNAGAGGLSGTILDAVTGEPVAGLELAFRRGIEARTGEAAALSVTDAAGGYLVTGLDYGNYTCEISGAGFQTVYTTVTVLGGIERDEQNAAVSPRPEVGETRIVLTWGATPDDLDAHLTGPGADGGEPFHVYFADGEAPGAELDRDDTTSFGPETITVDAASDEAPYRYSVHNFAGGAATVLSRSGAVVRVLRDEGVVAEFFVPNGEGNLWTVFDIVGGEIVPIDAIGTVDRDAVDDYFAPELRSGAAARRLVAPAVK